MSFRRALALLVLLLLSAGQGALAQNEPMLGSGSQVADLSDPFAFGLNPALGEMTLQQITAGLQVLHLGLLENSTDLSTGGLIYTTRKFGGGLSFDAGYLSTPFWGLKKFRAGYGRRIFAGLSLGLSVGLDQRSFDLSDVDLSQGSYLDPLMIGGLSRTVGIASLAAAYSLPLQGVTAALVMENPHQPNISLGGHDDSVYLPTTLRAGLSWERELFMLNAGMVDRRWRTIYAASARGNIYGEHSIKMSLESDQWTLGARVGIGRQAWLEYNYTQPRSELSDLTNGSHAIVICWHASGRAKPPVRYSHQHLDDGPYNQILTPVDVGFFPEAQQVTVAALEPTHGFFTVAASADTFLIRVKRLKRIFAEGMDMARVRRLPRWRIGVMDSTWSDRITWDITEDMTDAYPENDLPRGNYSAEYQAGIDSLNARLRHGQGGDLIIVANADQLDRARYLARKAGADSLSTDRIRIKKLQPLANDELRRMLMRPVGSDSIPSLQEITLRQYSAIAINLVSLGPVAGIQDWSLKIHDSLDQPVRSFSGQGPAPEQVHWDWRDARGQMVDVDQYTYQLHWRDAGGGLHKTISREILIVRQVMQRTLEFGVENTPRQDLQKQQPVLILDPGRSGLSVGRNEFENIEENTTQPGGK